MIFYVKIISVFYSLSWILGTYFSSIQANWAKCPLLAFEAGRRRKQYAEAGIQKHVAGARVAVYQELSAEAGRQRDVGVDVVDDGGGGDAALVPLWRYSVLVFSVERLSDHVKRLGRRFGFVSLCDCGLRFRSVAVLSSELYLK